MGLIQPDQYVTEILLVMLDEVEYLFEPIVMDYVVVIVEARFTSSIGRYPIASTCRHDVVDRILPNPVYRVKGSDHDYMIYFQCLAEQQTRHSLTGTRCRIQHVTLQSEGRYDMTVMSDELHLVRFDR